MGRGGFSLPSGKWATKVTPTREIVDVTSTLAEKITAQATTPALR